MKNSLLILTIFLAVHVSGQGSFNSEELNIQLKSSDSKVRIMALKAINSEVQKLASTYAPNGGVEAVLRATRSSLDPLKPELLRISNDQDSNVRAAVSIALGYVTPDVHVVDVLVKLVQDSEKDVQYPALSSLYLTDANEKRSRDTVVRLMNGDSNIHLFECASEIAVRWQISEAITPLIKALQNDDLQFKSSAAGFLSSYGSKADAALPELNLQFTNVTDPQIKGKMQNAINQIKSSKNR